MGTDRDLIEGGLPCEKTIIAIPCQPRSLHLQLHITMFSCSTPQPSSSRLLEGVVNLVAVERDDVSKGEGAISEKPLPLLVLAWTHPTDVNLPRLSASSKT
jgi:hypothetical protein